MLLISQLGITVSRQQMDVAAGTDQVLSFLVESKLVTNICLMRDLKECSQLGQFWKLEMSDGKTKPVAARQRLDLLVHLEAKRR